MVGVARYYHLFGMTSLSDSFKRLPASGIRVAQAEESVNGLRRKKSRDQRRPRVFQLEIPQEIAGPVTIRSRKEFAYAIFTSVLEFYQYLHKYVLNFYHIKHYSVLRGLENKQRT